MADSEMLDDGAMSIADAMKFTGLGKTELYKRMSAEGLPFLKIGKRRLIPRKALVNLLRGGLVGEAKNAQ